LDRVEVESGIIHEDVDSTGAFCDNRESEAIASTRAKKGHDTLSKTGRRTNESLPTYVVSKQQTIPVESRSSPRVLDLRDSAVSPQAEHKFESPDDSPPPKPPRWAAAALRGTQPPLLASGCEQRSAKPQAVARSAAANPPSETNLTVALGQIYRETEKYLSRLGRAAHEGRAVDEANNFLRWLQFSGVCRLLEMFSGLDERFLLLREQADALQDICLPHLQGRNIKEHPNQSRIDEVNDKLDYILSKMVKPSPLSTLTTNLGGPGLHVIAGGVISERAAG
jgi:hypothetical protein